MSIFRASNLLVTYVNGKNIYVQEHIDEMSENYGVSREEIANLAIVKLEKERIEREENGTRVS